MAAFDFPSSPTLNQVYSANGKSWIWDGAAWNPYGGTSGAMILLASATASSSTSIIFDNVFNPSLYASYELQFQGVYSATDNVDLRIQLRSTSPADITSFHRNNELYGRIDSTASGNTANAGSTSGWRMSPNWGTTDINRRGSGAMQIMPIVGEWTHMNYRLFLYSRLTLGQYYIAGAGACEGTTAPAGVKIYFSSGNIATGTFQLYGIKK